MDYIFTTERLSVRKFLKSDGNDLAEILTDKEVTYFEPYQTFSFGDAVEEAAKFSETSEFFAVVLDGKVIGKIYFSKRDHGTYEIGYTFNINYQRKGYAAESMSAFIGYAFNSLCVRRIIAEVDTRNEKSYKLCERLGMRREAEHKQVYPAKGGGYNDFYIYAMLKEEYVKYGDHSSN